MEVHRIVSGTQGVPWRRSYYSPAWYFQTMKNCNTLNPKKSTEDSRVHRHKGLYYPQGEEEHPAKVLVESKGNMG